MQTLTKTEPLAPLTDAEFTRAVQAAEESDNAEPRIAATSYDAGAGVLQLTMRNGAAVSIPVALFPSLANATPEQIASARIEENGAALFWDALDVQMSTIALLQIAFRFRTVSDNARRAARTKSPARAAAARANGRKGGRPRRSLAPA